MNSDEFSKAYAKYVGVSQKEASEICNTVFEFLGKVLFKDEEDVTIYKFGAFKHITFSPKKARHPSTGEIITIPQRQVVKFKPSENPVDYEN